MKINTVLFAIVIQLAVKCSLSECGNITAKVNSVISKYVEMKELYVETINVYKSNVDYLQNRLKKAEEKASELENKLNEKEGMKIDKSNNQMHPICNDIVNNLFLELNTTKTELATKNKEFENYEKNITIMQDTFNDLNEEYIFCGKKVSQKNKLIDQLNLRLQQSEARNIEILNEIKTRYDPRSCMAFSNSNSVHTLELPEFPPFKVLCNSKLAGPGWTVIQRRLNGSVNFYRNWEEYKNGFGELSGEFFIGLEKLYRMTKAEPTELYIYMEDFKGETRYVKYDHFEIGSEEESYYLKSLGRYEGNISNKLVENLYEKFSTIDRVADELNENCAEILEGGWWYSNPCGYTNLNGVYQIADTDYESMGKGIFWESEWHTFEYSLKTVIMQIRPLQNN